MQQEKIKGLYLKASRPRILFLIKHPWHYFLECSLFFFFFNGSVSHTANLQPLQSCRDNVPVYLLSQVYRSRELSSHEASAQNNES